MKSSKILSFVILATALSGFSQAGAQTINETRTGYVTAVETVWTQRIINEPVTTTSCHTNQAHQGFHVYLLTLLCFFGFAMESLAVGNCGSPALDLGSRKPDGWVEVRVRNFVYAWRRSKSCPRIQHLRKTHTTILLDTGFLCLVFFANLAKQSVGRTFGLLAVS